ncbi:MAG: hypothetical protein JW812_02155 [Alphaproteobacteria bacterium]|nr:hypothetical protein [Alphaproteobacteria bacterium]MBN2779574.1 hypothetical protein [Alphaproteobacteria bacterium]
MKKIIFMVSMVSILYSCAENSSRLTDDAAKSATPDTFTVTFPPRDPLDDLPDSVKEGLLERLKSIEPDDSRDTFVYGGDTVFLINGDYHFTWSDIDTNQRE